MNIATCIGCGCTDEQACVDLQTGVTCCWLRVDRAQGLGVCSCCDEDLDRWDAGDARGPVSRELMPPW